MLVIPHQNQVITCLGVGFVIPMRIVERRRNGNNQALRLEGGMDLTQKSQSILVSIVGDLLEIDDEALELMLLDERQDAGQAFAPSLRVRQKAGEVRAIPFCNRRVLDHRQNGCSRLLPPDQIKRLLIEGDLEVHRASLQIEPARNHPIEALDVIFE